MPKAPSASPCVVVATDEFVAWWERLPEKQHDAVRVAIDLLEQFGIALPFPHSSAIEGSRHALRELRRKSGKHQLRVFYVFDHTREAIVLIGGDKLGVGNRIFYDKMVPAAENIWEQYLREQGRERRGNR
jgi:hypothetical protein